MNKLRFEYKYLMPNYLIIGFVKSIIPYVQYDKFALNQENKEYTVRSIYFDSHNYEAYHEKTEGIKDRKKIRVRVYNDREADAIAFLEIKRKYENHIFKNRAKVPYENIEEVFSTNDPIRFVVGADSEEIDNASMFMFNINKKNMKPVALITYDRLAFFAKFNSMLRITIDKNLRAMISPNLSDIYENRNLVPCFLNKSILEIKFQHGFPNWLTKKIQLFRLNRYALSKYTICLDSLKNSNQAIHQTQLTLPISNYSNHA